MSTTTPFFGRQEELAALNRTLADPRGQAILVIGPEGMGKSTLIEHFLQEVENKETTPRLCVTMSFRLTRDDESRFFLRMMLSDIEAAIQENAGFLSVTPRGRTQLKALFDLIPQAQKLRDLFTSLEGRRERHPRDEFIEYLATLSSLLPHEARAVVAIDANKRLHDASDDTWRVIAERLPEKIVLIFGQRPDDVLAASPEFLALTNVSRIPDGDLHSLSAGDVREFVVWASGETGLDEALLAPAMESYDGHPYALAAAAGLLRDGVSLDALPADPTPERLAQAQWRRLMDRPDGPEAMRLLKAHAILEVPVPVAVARKVGGLDADRQESLLANRFIASLLRETGHARAVYHAMLRDHIMAQIDADAASEYHQRAADAYRHMLAEARRTQTAPDPLACSRAVAHAHEAKGISEAIKVFAYECMEPLIRLGLLEAVVTRAERYLEHVPEDSQDGACLLSGIGIVMYWRGDVERAEAMHRQALEISKKLGWSKGMAAEYAHLGIVMEVHGDFDKAEKMHRRSLEVSEQFGWLEVMAGGYSNLGLVLEARDDLDDAEAMHRQALEISKKLGCFKGIAGAYGNLGLVMERRRNLGEAEKLFRQLLEICEELGWSGGMANAYGNLGSIMRARGDAAGAREAWTKAADLFDRVGAKHLVEKTQTFIDELPS